MYSIQSLLLRSPVILSKKIIWICVEYLGKAFQTWRTVWYGSRHWHPCYWSRKLWCRIFSRLVLDGADTSSLHVQGEGTGLMWTVVSHRQASWVACRWRDSRSRGPCIQKQTEELYIMNATIWVVSAWLFTWKWYGSHNLHLKITRCSILWVYRMYQNALRGFIP